MSVPFSSTFTGDTLFTMLSSEFCTSVTVSVAVAISALCSLERLAVFVMNVINLDYSALYSILLLAFVLFSFAFTDFAGGNGYLAVYIAGLVVGNNPMIHKKSVITFFDGLTWLFQIVMFLVLGLLATPSELLKVWKPAVAIGVFMIIAARPLTVFACLLPFRKFNIKSKSFISWVVLCR